MAEFEKHLYMIIFPINALLSSQLEPEQLGEHYVIGSVKHFRGKMIFAEIDINFRDPYFAIDKALDETVAHTDGSPKKTKFISSYNVLEHVDLDAIKRLFLCIPNGKVLPLEPSEFATSVPSRMLRIYQEITPLENLVASNLNQIDLGRLITREQKAKGAPKIAFTQLNFDVKCFIDKNKDKDIFYVDIPNMNPYHLYESLLELRNKPHKKTKTLSLGSLLGDISYKFIYPGFWFVDGEKMRFFAMPSQSDLKNKYYYWWRFVK